MTIVDAIKKVESITIALTPTLLGTRTTITTANAITTLATTGVTVKAAAGERSPQGKSLHKRPFSPKSKSA